MKIQKDVVCGIRQRYLSVYREKKSGGGGGGGGGNSIVQQKYGDEDTSVHIDYY